MLGEGHAVESGHFLALGAGGQNDLLLKGHTLELRDIHEGVFRHLQVAQLAGDRHHVFHAAAADGDLALVGGGYMAIKGDMTIGSTGKIDLLGKGYSAKHAPSGQSTASGAYQGVAHGGHGLKWAETETPGLTIPYDSIVNPTEAGIGGENSAGGGILLMDVAGKLTVDGTLTADAAKSSNYHGSGGTINITAGELAGAGTITASAPAEAQHAAAGGGRVAVALTKTDADFSGFTGHIWACGQWSRVNSNKRRMGGAGTVYLKTAAQEVGSLTLANNTANDVDIQGVTPVGAAYEGTEFQDITVREKTRLVVPEGETLTIRGNLTDEGRFECGAGSTVVFAGADMSRIAGNVTFANLAAEAPGKAIVVDDGAVIEVTGDGALSGAVDNNLTLRSATSMWCSSAGGTGRRRTPWHLSRRSSTAPS